MMMFLILISHPCRLYCVEYVVKNQSWIRIAFLAWFVRYVLLLIICNCMCSISHFNWFMLFYHHRKQLNQPIKKNVSAHVIVRSQSEPKKQSIDSDAITAAAVAASAAVAATHPFLKVSVLMVHPFNGRWLCLHGYSVVFQKESWFGNNIFILLSDSTRWCYIAPLRRVGV